MELQDLDDPVRAPHAVQLLAEELPRLRMFTIDNPRQQARLDEMTPLMAQPLRTQAALRRLAEQMRADEISLQLTRKQRARSSLDHIYLTTAGSLVLALSLFAFAWWRLSQQLKTQQTALQQLRETEAQTTALLENGVDAVWAVDRELRLTARNRRFAQLAQAAGVLVDGKRDDVGLSLADYAAWQEPYARALDGERVTIEVSHELRGHVRHFMCLVRAHPRRRQRHGRGRVRQGHHDAQASRAQAAAARRDAALSRRRRSADASLQSARLSRARRRALA